MLTLFRAASEQRDDVRMAADPLHDLELAHEVLLLALGGALLHRLHGHEPRRALVTRQVVRFRLPDLQRSISL